MERKYVLLETADNCGLTEFTGPWFLERDIAVEFFKGNFAAIKLHKQGAIWWREPDI